MKTPIVDLSALERVLGEATPLPWQAQTPDEVDVFVPIIGVILNEDGTPLETPTNGLVGGATLFPTEIDAEDYTRAQANAALIVAAVNALPDLLALARRAEKAEEERDATLAALRPFTRAVGVEVNLDGDHWSLLFPKDQPQPTIAQIVRARNLIAPASGGER